MLPFGVTIPATVPQRSEIPEGLTTYPVLGEYYGPASDGGRNTGNLFNEMPAIC
jgi:hypothetical protein